MPVNLIVSLMGSRWVADIFDDPEFHKI